MRKEVKYFILFISITILIKLLGCPVTPSDDNEIIIRQFWSSESQDSDVEWYNGSLPIQYKCEEQDEVKMEEINIDTAITTIYVDSTRIFQKFIGFGESFEGSTTYNLSRMSQSKRTEVLQKLIDPNVGANLNIFRICIGTSDFTPSEWGFYSYDDMPDGEEDLELTNFSIQKDIENNIISILQEVLQFALIKNVNIKFIASPWSPPGWMKNNNPDSMIGGSLQAQYNDLYAEYLYRFLVAYKNEGIPIYAITIQNEPGWICETPSTDMSPEQEAEIIIKLKELIDNDSNINTKILAYDWNFHDITYPTVILNNQQAKDSICGIAFHAYDWEINDEDNILQLANAHPTIKMYHTEREMWCASGMDLIIKMFRHQICTYTGWVTMLDNDNIDDGNEDEQYPDTPTPPAFILDSSNTDNYWITPTYYLKQQFSKFIQIGAKRIYSNKGAFNLSNIAFLNPDNTIVLIVVNQDESSKIFRVINDSKQFIVTIPEKVVATYFWNLSQNNEQEKTNLAAGKSVFVSSVENADNIGENVVDCDTDTRWASEWTDNEWITIDIGFITTINRVVLDWEDAYGKEYKILISNDNIEWNKICHEKNGYIGVNIHDINSTGRYVKMKGIERGTSYGYSLYEFEIY